MPGGPGPGRTLRLAAALAVLAGACGLLSSTLWSLPPSHPSPRPAVQQQPAAEPASAPAAAAAAPAAAAAALLAGSAAAGGGGGSADESGSTAGAASGQQSAGDDSAAGSSSAAAAEGATRPAPRRPVRPGGGGVPAGGALLHGGIRTPRPPPRPAPAPPTRGQGPVFDVLSLPPPAPPPTCPVAPATGPVPRFIRKKTCRIVGLNNQLVLILWSYLCERKRRREQGEELGVVQWRDISCTSERVGNKKAGYVDSKHFRWSALLNTPLSIPLCFSDGADWVRTDNCPYVAGREEGRKHEWGASAEWWAARRSLDWRPRYYSAAQWYVKRTFGGEPYIAVHLRRGDFLYHCRKEDRHLLKGLEPKLAPVDSWLYLTERSGDPNRSSLSKTFMNACYPPFTTVVQALRRVAANVGVKQFFVTCTERTGKYSPGGTFQRMMAPLKVASLPYRSGSFAEAQQEPFAAPDALELETGVHKDIVDLAVISMGAHLVLNRFSTFSGTAVEMAILHGRVRPNGSNVWWF
eukprot:TRINITY_DN14789_c0_g2_i1.p1 TRINITY_DN14789_c0_g2~~TRINITY_DN14789_c0_g2_i1.p1  ORF type:complete len:521 (+),score=107.23 TRINITY_DN14789_c0_g2_i1:85-1647(+)